MDPIARFVELLERAKQTPSVADPTGMTLSTVGGDGRPPARGVLLKGIDAQGIVFYTNTRSRKGRDLAAQPAPSLSFWWPPLEAPVPFGRKAALVIDARAAA